jgi:hypothetical protein
VEVSDLLTEYNIPHFLSKITLKIKCIFYINDVNTPKLPKCGKSEKSNFLFYTMRSDGVYVD